INELIRSDGTWAGYRRNVFFFNNGDGTFSDISGAVGLDFPDDSRAFALADFDHDGRLEIALKNRTGPQLRILRCEATGLGNVLALWLRGVKSNRDAVGAVVILETAEGRQMKILQAGTGFPSQHTKEIFSELARPSPPAPRFAGPAATCSTLKGCLRIAASRSKKAGRDSRRRRSIPINLYR